MEEVLKIGAKEASREFLKNTNVNISLEGWPCAVAVVGLGIVYVISTKIRCDSQRTAESSDKLTCLDQVV